MTRSEFRLSVGATLGEAVREVSSNAVPLLRALVLPALLMFVLDYGYGYWHVDHMEALIADLRDSEKRERAMDIFWLVTIAYNLMGGVVYAVYAVSCHRIVLLGHSSLPSSTGLYLTGRELRYVAFLLLFSLPMVGLIAAMPLYLPYPDEPLWQLWLVAKEVLPLLLTTIVLSIFGLRLPATAIDKDITFREARRLIKGNTIRMFAALLIIPVLWRIFDRGHTYLDAQITAEIIWIPLWILLILASFVVVAIEVIVLSVAYRGLVRRQEAGA